MSNEKDTSDFIKHVPCENCGSSDANSLYSDGHQFCFACDAYVPGEGEVENNQRAKAAGLLTYGGNEGRIEALPARKITKETCAKYGYWLAKMNGKSVQVADYRTADGSLVGQKIRDKDKNFVALGKVSNDTLYGAHLWSGKGKMIVITEGEIDCLSVAQLQGLKWPVVSLPCGAKAARKSIAANLSYLEGYEKIVLMFDNDEPGRLATQEAAEVLPPGKTFVAHLPDDFKDANAALQEGAGQDVINAIWNAAPYRPDGIVAAKDLKSRVMSRAVVESIRFPLGGTLNAMTLGARKGEVIMLTSGSGMGKSSFAREVAYGWGHLTGMKTGLAFIEEAVEETLLDIMGLHLGKRIRQFPETTTPEEKSATYDLLFDNDQFYLYDHFGSAEEDSLVNKLKYMAQVMDCEAIILDHLSIVVSGMENGEDERKTIDRLMTKLKTAAKAANVILICVTHLKRKDGKSKGHEEGAQISLSELRGSGAIAQLSDTVIGFERDQQGEDPNLVLIRVLKCRFTGDTGEAGYLRFNKTTGRLMDDSPDFSDSPEPSSTAPPEEEF